VNARRCPFPTTQSSQRHLCAWSLPRPGRGVCALSSPDLFLSSLSFRPSTLNRSSLTPFFATLTNHLQPIENAITLSPVFASLTDIVKHKSFACHSCRKHRGVGYTAQSKFLSSPHVFPNSFVIRTSAKRSGNSGRIRIYGKTGGWASLQLRMARRNSSQPGRESVLFSRNTSLGI